MAELLEREGQLAELAGAVEAAVAGRGSVVLLGGEAGVGKTSLVRALAERVGGRVAFLSGACEALSVPVPLGPLRELFEAAVALAGRLGDERRRRRGRALMVLSYALWSLERVAQARTAAEQAIAAFEPTGDVASLAWALRHADADRRHIVRSGRRDRHRPARAGCYACWTASSSGSERTHSDLDSR